MFSIGASCRLYQTSVPSNRLLASDNIWHNMLNWTLCWPIISNTKSQFPSRLTLCGSRLKLIKLIQHSVGPSKENRSNQFLLMCMHWIQLPALGEWARDLRWNREANRKLEIDISHSQACNGVWASLMYVSVFRWCGYVVHNVNPLKNHGCYSTCVQLNSYQKHLFSYFCFRSGDFLREICVASATIS